jgi:hypothetical protein
LHDLRADAIDDGTIWRSRGEHIDPATRVDWRLLDNLKALGAWLRVDKKLEPSVAHALIGKFVYLRYLRDRNIISNRKLEALGVDPDAAFGRDATLAGVRALIQKVDDWLNGSVFPFPFTGPKAPKTEHVQRVAGVFLGDDTESGQLHLDFRAYDFSFIPIETLSVIYEQFLSAADANREKGAYYTPIHLVNFMLGELNDMRRLEPGRTVLDPSCGSGAFLVQCYRRLVERHIGSVGATRPRQLRELLVNNIFGIDRDEDACQVSGLSLVLAMLDYIDPPDLQSTPQFQLPDLIGVNIFVDDFFDPDATWVQTVGARKFDWIVGNPPWMQAGTQSGDGRDETARAWMKANAATRPVTNTEVAEAFAWKAMDHVSPLGAVGLLLPAMTLFKDSPAFRAAYFEAHDVAAVANFTNFRRDLFVKAETPAAAIFTRGSPRSVVEHQESIAVFSPLVANQAVNSTKPGRRREPWIITVDNSELQQLSRTEIRDGAMLPWKVAMWGGPRDLHLLRSIQEFATLGAFVAEHGLAISQGLELKDPDETSEAVVSVKEVAGKAILDVKSLKNVGRIYEFPPAFLDIVPKQRAFARRRGGVGQPLSVCRPPHVIVSGARTFATYSDDFIVVPNMQIGISGRSGQATLLKALALYLNSDFAQYYEFFFAPQGGIREGRITVGILRQLPVPFERLTERELDQWAAVYDELATTQRKLWRLTASTDAPRRLVDTTSIEDRIAALEVDANRAASKVLGLTDEEQVLVRDLVHVRRRLADGLVPADVVRKPDKNEMEKYAKRLERTLDEAVEDSEPRRHRVAAVADAASGMVQIELVAVKTPRTSSRRVIDASEPVGEAFSNIRHRMEQARRQWLYFDRNLFLFDGPRTYILKPLQRLWWTESQALADADYLVAEALGPAEAET